MLERMDGKPEARVIEQMYNEWRILGMGNRKGKTGERKTKEKEWRSEERRGEERKRTREAILKVQATPPLGTVIMI